MEITRVKYRLYTILEFKTLTQRKHFSILYLRLLNFVCIVATKSNCALLDFSIMHFSSGLLHFVFVILHFCTRMKILLNNTKFHIPGHN